MKKYLLLILPFILLSCAQKTMEFTVLDSNDNPVPNALVVLYPEDPDLSLTEALKKANVELTNEHGKQSFTKNFNSYFFVTAFSPDMSKSSEVDQAVFNPKTNLRFTREISDMDSLHDYAETRRLHYFWPVKALIKNNIEKSNSNHEELLSKKQKAIELYTDYISKSRKMSCDEAREKVTRWIEDQNIFTID